MANPLDNPIVQQPGKNTFGPTGLGFPGSSGIGGSFTKLYGGAPHAAITRPKVALPSRGDFGGPVAAPNIADPNRGDFGLSPADQARQLKGINDTRNAALQAEGGFLNPRGTTAFKNLMGLAGEQTAAQESERRRNAMDATSRRGFAGGFEDEERQAKADRMTALATAGFEGAAAVQQAEGEQYGRAVGAFASLQNAYTQAQAEGNTAFAHDLTQTHIAQAEATLKAADLNVSQQLAYGKALNDAKALQAQLDEAFNKDLIDNNRYISGQQQIAAQIQAQMAALQERKVEFGADLAERQRQFDLSLKANPMTATRTFEDPRYGGAADRTAGRAPGGLFGNLLR